MPDSTISAPVAADPIDRLVLGATDARALAVFVDPLNAGTPAILTCNCMAEE